MNEAQRAAAVLGRLGGSVKSAAKTAAARDNGRKGGRPFSRPVAWMFDVPQGRFKVTARSKVEAWTQLAVLCPTCPKQPKPYHE